MNISFSFTDETLKFVGEYLVDRNSYNYYLVTHTSSEMAVGGQMRSSVRLEITISNPSMWTARAYTHVDGKEVKVQEYKFLKAS